MHFVALADAGASCWESPGFFFSPSASVLTDKTLVQNSHKKQTLKNYPLVERSVFFFFFVHVCKISEIV